MFFAALMAVFAGSIVAWTQSSAGFQIIIPPLTNDQGEVVKIVEDQTSFGGTVSVPQGATRKTRGVELYEIKMGTVELCAQVGIDLLLQNAQDMGQVLNSPNAFIDVGIWYPEDTGSESFVTLDRTGQTLWKDDDPEASKLMSRENGMVTLYPSQTVTSTLHILGSIVVGSKNQGYPEGQQGQLLKFWVEVKKRRKS